MRVLIACEFSGIVRDAFRECGHDAVSCDLIPSETEGPHYSVPVQYVPRLESYELLIAFPPCTYLAVSGARWFKDRREQQAAAIEFVRWVADCPVERIAIENPIGVLSSKWRKPDQIIQPWQFGHGETKATCLWLKNLPKLQPTEIVAGRVPRVHHEPPGPDRQKNRSRTYLGIGKAMAEQWGCPEERDNL